MTKEKKNYIPEDCKTFDIVPTNTEVALIDEKDFEVGEISSEKQLREEYAKTASSAMSRVKRTIAIGEREDEIKLRAAVHVLDKLLPSQTNFVIEKFIHLELSRKKEMIINFINKEKEIKGSKV